MSLLPCATVAAPGQDFWAAYGSGGGGGPTGGALSGSQLTIVNPLTPTTTAELYFLNSGTQLNLTMSDGNHTNSPLIFSQSAGGNNFNTQVRGLSVFPAADTPRQDGSISVRNNPGVGGVSTVWNITDYAAGVTGFGNQGDLDFSVTQNSSGLTYPVLQMRNDTQQCVFSQEPVAPGYIATNGTAVGTTGGSYVSLSMTPGTANTSVIVRDTSGGGPATTDSTPIFITPTRTRGPNQDFITAVQQLQVAPSSNSTSSPLYTQQGTAQISITNRVTSPADSQNYVFYNPAITAGGLTQNHLMLWSYPGAGGGPYLAMDVAANGTITFPNTVTFSVPPVGAGGGLAPRTTLLYDTILSLNTPNLPSGRLFAQNFTAPATGVYLVEYQLQYSPGNTTAGVQDGFAPVIYQTDQGTNVVKARATMPVPANNALTWYPAYQSVTVMDTLTSGVNYTPNLYIYNNSGTLATTLVWNFAIKITSLC
jgi:hypothetical protein